MLVLTTIISLIASIEANAQYSQYGVIGNFYGVNPDLPMTASTLVNPNYILIDWNRRNEMESRTTAGGFSRLGTSNWNAHDVYGGGVPERDLAIAYAQAIGADIRRLFNALVHQV